MLTLEKLKRYLNIQDTAQDLLLTDCINSAAAYCDSYTNRHLGEGDFTLTDLRVSDAGIIYLPNYPISKINKAYYEWQSIWYEFDVTGNVEVITEESIRINLQKYPYRYFKIEYTGGYADENMPLDLEQAMKMLAAEYYYNSAAGGGRQGISSKNWNSQMSEGASFKSAIPEINLMLDKYRRGNI